MTDEFNVEQAQLTSPAKKSGAPLVWVLFLFMLVLAGALGVGYTQLTKVNAALAQQVSAIRQQSDNDVSHVQSLAQSVQQLQQANNVSDNQDVTAIYTRLIAVNEQLDQLPLPPTPLQPDTTTAPTVDESNMSWWEIGLNRSLQALQKIVIVRYNENKTAPMILPEERHFLYQSLHAEMQSAIWGVLHRNSAVYHTSLARVMNWVQQYFVQSSPETAALLQELNALQSVDVKPQDTNGGRI